MKLASPEQIVEILWVPRLRVEVVRLAWPPLRVTLAKVLLPSLKVMVPLGVPMKANVGVTVVVKVTACPR